MEKSVYMHTDDFYHYLRKGAIPPPFTGIKRTKLDCNRGFFRISKAFCPWWIRCNCRRYYRPVVFKAVVKNCARGYEVHYIVLRANKEETMRRAINRSKLDRKTNIELVEVMWEPIP